MGLSRLVIFVLLAFVGWTLWKKYRLTTKAAATKQQQPKDLPMVRCQHCGVHLPQPDALHHNNQWYCNEHHARSHQSQD